MSDKDKRIAWCITGSGHYLKESIEAMKKNNNVDLFLSKAGEEVLKSIKIIPVSDAFSILEHTLSKPVIPINLSESELQKTENNQSSIDQLKENITH